MRGDVGRNEGRGPSQLHSVENTLCRFCPHMLIELSAAHLARAGDQLDDAFAFLSGLGYTAFELTSGGGLVPVAAPHDGDFWFIWRDDPVPAMS